MSQSTRAEFQSTPSTRRETQRADKLRDVCRISIHSLHTEGDLSGVWFQRRRFQISIHSLHTEGDFQNRWLHWLPAYFNPLPPHGGRPYSSGGIWEYLHISIHSLHTEGDLAGEVAAGNKTLFQSTPSTRRETLLLLIIMTQLMYFNPLPPHGGRQQSHSWVCGSVIFQSTPSTRRETDNVIEEWVSTEISIHSLHTEGDIHEYSPEELEQEFQSTPSTRRETVLLLWFSGIL